MRINIILRHIRTRWRRHMMIMEIRRLSGQTIDSIISGKGNPIYRILPIRKKFRFTSEWLILFDYSLYPLKQVTPSCVNHTIALELLLPQELRHYFLYYNTLEGEKLHVKSMTAVDLHERNYGEHELKNVWRIEKESR